MIETKPMKTKNELKPCPFCASDKIEFASFNNGDAFRIRCQNCNIASGFFDTNASAIGGWNNRKGEQNIAKEILKELEGYMYGLENEIVVSQSSIETIFESVFAKLGVNLDEN